MSCRWGKAGREGSRGTGPTTITAWRPALGKVTPAQVEGRLAWAKRPKQPPVHLLPGCKGGPIQRMFKESRVFFNARAEGVIGLPIQIPHSDDLLT
jgi:hypothetical protein